jgi:transposase-like protein
MHLTVRLPKVEPQTIQPPTRCPLLDPKNRKKRCRGTHFKEHQLTCAKPLRDTRYTQVTARRYRCLKCRGSFRIYPTGVSPARHSDTLKGLSVLLYILGLSYQGVSDLLDSLGLFLSKATVYKNVQATGQRAIRLRQTWVKQQTGQVQVLGLDFTHLKCQGQDKILAVATAVLTGAPLTFDLIEAETALRTEQWIRELAQTLGAEVLVTDDADGLRKVADDLGVKHQVCRAHVNRKVHELIGGLGTKALGPPDQVPWELSPAVTLDEFLEDLQDVEWIIKSVPANGQAQLDQLAARYQGVPPPAQGQKATMWYRMRRLTLDWSENWSRLALYLQWRGEQGARLDGTNNVTEQVIGQRVKERYRTMRGYKREQSILNVSSLIGWVRMKGADYDLAELLAN